MYMADTSFNVGDKTVYPGHGVAEIVGLEKQEISGHALDFYVLRVLENNMTVRVPKHKADTVGLRRLVREEEVEQVYQVLRHRGGKISTATWNRRYREYMEKIKTGSVFEIAEVLRDLYLLKGDKDLSFGERKMLDTARSLLIKELSLAKGCSEDDIESDLKRIFSISA